MGRPSRFKPEYVTQASKLCQLGATDRELADFFNVSESTIHQWKISHPEFSESLKLGKESADARVAQSLYRRAVGYSFDSEKIFNDKTNGIVRTPCVEHVVPDVTACIFWLKNRKPQEWRDVKSHEHNGTITLEQLITGDLEADERPAVSQRSN
jgi:hypothetical protein